MIRVGIIVPSLLVPGYMTYLDRQISGLEKCKKKIFTLKCGTNKDSCGYDVVVLSNDTITSKVIKKANWVLREKLLGGKCWVNQDFLSIIKLKKILNKSQLDIIVVHFLGMAIAFLSVLKKANMPVLVYCHESEVVEFIKIKEYRCKLKNLFNIATLFICPSQYMKSIIVGAGCPEEKVKLLYLGVELPILHGSLHTEEKAKFISTGRLVQIKNYDLLIDSFIRANQRDSTLRIIGDGPLKEHLKIKAMGENNIEIVGSLPNRLVYEELLRSNIYIQSSDGENLPIAILEAMACGLPVIATNVGGVGEIVEHEKTGFLVKKNDVEGMARYIKLLSTNCEMRQKLGKAGLMRSHESFDCKKQDQKLEELLLEIIKRS